MTLLWAVLTWLVISAVATPLLAACIAKRGGFRHAGVERRPAGLGRAGHLGFTADEDRSADGHWQRSDVG